jgi:DNA-binding FadR family transcriptional regulator
LVLAPPSTTPVGSPPGPDREFHMLIARSTGNGAIARTIEQLWALRSTSPECVVVFARARRGGSKPVVEEHGAIVRALRARDPAAARGAMRAHLAAVIEHLLVTTEAEAVEQARETARTTRDRFSRAGRL